MKHLLISVGCDQYRSLSSLSGAERDARNVFVLLTDEHHGDCTPGASVLLLSPSLGDFSAALSELLANIQSGDVLTFFFAGHGVVKNSIFYMCLEDTQPHGIAITAFPLTTLLSSIQEANPAHANIVIDACNSGGVMGDFSRALSPDNIGNAGTIGISLLAACAQDQFASEQSGAGAFTSALISCIDGRTYIQDVTTYLDLAEIAGSLSRRTILHSQLPVFWGLNLTGHRNFCINPHASEDSPLRKTLAEARPLNLTSKLKQRLQDIYADVDEHWNPSDLRDVLLLALSESGVSTIAKLGFINEVALSLRTRSSSSLDPFREVEVAATCLSALLELCTKDERIEHYVANECRNLARVVCQKIEDEIDFSKGRGYSLLGQTGLGELYFLPVRISKILGWLGWSIRVLEGADEGLDAAGRILALILDRYAGSLRSVSETQAPHVFAFGAALYGSRLQPEAEQVIGAMFLDACEAKGAIATTLAASDVIPFLLDRSAGHVKHRYIANPSTLLFVLTYLGAVFDLDEGFDHGLIDLDHKNMNAFIPETYADFSRRTISGGYNATVRIGHDAWTTGDIRAVINRLSMPAPESPGVALLSGACSLIYPDRVAWHLLPAGG